MLILTRLIKSSSKIKLYFNFYANVRKKHAYDIEGIGTRLAYALKRKGWFYRDLERKTGYTSTQVSNYINAKVKNPSLQALESFADALDVSFEWLAYNIGQIDDLSSIEGVMKDSRTVTKEKLEQAIQELQKERKAREELENELREIRKMNINLTNKLLGKYNVAGQFAPAR